MNRRFDLASDLHVDFWVKFDSNPIKMKQKTDGFIDSIIHPDHSMILVIAGDMGHYNRQNELMLNSFKRYYEYILIVRGNHDLYLVSGQQEKKYGRNSSKRWNEMKEIAGQIEGVYILEGDVITLKGITFGGTGMWYDFSYGMLGHDKTEEELVRLWKKEMNDAGLIRGLPDFIEESAKLSNIINDSEVIITHVGGDWSMLSPNSKYVQGLTPSFYFFDGSKWMDQLQGKVWCFGHIHDHFDYIKNGCRFVNNAIGYPRDNPDVKIKTISI
ncbi:metallophosphoesterase [Aneurinibacillus uraniidurans]|uniref:metallophosphoesterase n=1 Tax=Aneurinibacillus uraniidurans TaxID=2966586 RepID=UPI00234941A6|nr:metallophosphoesterase [Aneurinibacillus sp. B1]WCN39507.1 metallophosphoesterase [Aneurinibacillus sp. B1]